MTYYGSGQLAGRRPLTARSDHRLDEVDGIGSQPVLGYRRGFPITVGTDKFRSRPNAGSARRGGGAFARFVR